MAPRLAIRYTTPLSNPRVPNSKIAIPSHYVNNDLQG